MDLFQAIILGIVQGISEFLPISSSGHLVLFQRLFGVNGEASMTFDIILHLGTFIPVVIVFWQDIWQLLKKPFQKMTYLLIVGTVPTVAVALLFKDAIESLFEGGILLGFGFLLTAIFLLIADAVKSGKKADRQITYADALVIGCFQGLAITPAISRSGSTITGSLLRGLSRETAAKYSFLLSLPAILGAAVLEFADVARGKAVLDSIGFLPAFAGFLAAMVSGYISIRFMLALIQSCKLKYFSYYLFALAAFIFLDGLLIHRFF